MTTSQLKEGDPVRIIKECSDNFNPHIRHTIGEVAVVYAIEDGIVNIHTFSGGIGSIDIDCIEKIEDISKYSINEKYFLISGY